MPEAQALWKRVILAGVLIAAFGAVYFAISATYSSFNVVLPAIGIGLLTVIVGLVGWAASLGRRARARIAGLALLPPAFVVIIGVFTNPNSTAFSRSSSSRVSRFSSPGSSSASWL